MIVMMMEERRKSRRGREGCASEGDAGDDRMSFGDDQCGQMVKREGKN
jgi:hypothetical protein